MMAITIGELIAILERIKPDTLIQGIGPLVCYRGDYSYLAVCFCPPWPEPAPEPIPVGALIIRLKQATRKWFTGYKGGRLRPTLSTGLYRVPSPDMTGDPVVGVALGENTWLMTAQTETHVG